MTIDGTDYIGGFPTMMGVLGCATGSPSQSDMSAMSRKLDHWTPTWEMDRGRKSAKIVLGLQVPVVGTKTAGRDTFICQIVEPKLEELSEVPLLK
jgi:hypothetical protein